jgi:hypothetical protein
MSNYIGPTINKTGRLRDLPGGRPCCRIWRFGDGSTPPGCVVGRSGVHGVRDHLQEHIMQLCHADLHNEFRRYEHLMWLWDSIFGASDKLCWPRNADGRPARSSLPTGW